MEFRCNKCNSLNVVKTEGTAMHTAGLRCLDCRAHRWLSNKYGSTENKEEIWAKTRGRCAYCGIDINPFRKNSFDIDHIEAQSRGGLNGIDNLYMSCPKCNRIKKDKTLEEFRQILQKKNFLIVPFTFYYELNMAEVEHVETIIDTELGGVNGKI